MTYFLTSSTVLGRSAVLNPANGFVEALCKSLPGERKGLFICSDPEGHQRTDSFAASVRESFEGAGIAVASLDVLDGRNRDKAEELAAGADLIVLAGGHVPTQNRFFAEIGLAGLLKGWPGVLVGISAGSMNAAREVYAQPEEEGEALSSDYQRFLPGLGITGTVLLPHYQMVKDEVVDGLRLFEDITIPDSLGKTFYAIPDGSYLLGQNGREELRGEAWRIRDGKMEQVGTEGDVFLLT